MTIVMKTATRTMAITTTAATITIASESVANYSNNKQYKTARTKAAAASTTT